MIAGFFIANFLIILKEKFANDKITCIFAELLILYLIIMKLTQHQLDRLDENFANYNCGIYSYERHEEIRKEILNHNN